MTAEDQTKRPATLPELEAQLVRAARRRATAPPRWRRWGLPVGLGALLAAGGVALAASGVFRDEPRTIDAGTTPRGGYVIKVKPHDTDLGPICLQLRFAGARPAYGCGYEPTAAKPFGLVIADGQGEGSSERVIYGLVAEDIVRVGVLGDGDRQTIAETIRKPGLPGRYFSVEVPNEGRIEIVGYDKSGGEIARIGSRAEPEHRPLSRDEAIAQGDPAGFAPTAVPARWFYYEGRKIEPRRAASLGLDCSVGPAKVRCFDSVNELQASQAPG